jgi:hypothetical protein
MWLKALDHLPKNKQQQQKPTTKLAVYLGTDFTMALNYLLLPIRTI